MIDSRRQVLKGIFAGAICAGLFPIVGCSEKSINGIKMQSPWINDAEFIGYFVGLHNKTYQKHGLDFEYMPGGPEIIADSVLLAKRAEIALTTPDVTFNAITKQNAPFKIVGAQYQKSPLGIVTLAKNNINEPKDLIGKTIAVPPANHLTISAFFKLNNIGENQVKVVPYQYDPTPLLKGEVDATLDFVTNVPFTIEERGEQANSFLLYDYGFKIFNDTVTVRNDYLAKNKDEVIKWLAASKEGWVENYNNPEKYAKLFMNSYFKGTGRSLANEIYFNNAQKELILNDGNVFRMSESAVQDNIRSLEVLGIKAKESDFVLGLV